MIHTTLLTLALAVAPPAPFPGTPSPAPSGRPSTRPPAVAPLTPDELYSRRALRRARLLIQMRVMQLRDEQLECIREALRRRLPDALWPEVPSPSRGAADASAAVAKCASLPE